MTAVWKMTRRGVFGALMALLGGPWLAEEAEAVDQDRNKDRTGAGPGGRFFELEALLAEHAKKGRAYHEFLRVKTLHAGLYRLEAGQRDGQAPHDEDEVYYVIRGKAKFRAADEVTPVGPGAVLYVAAGVPHRFEAIEDDLTLLVLFSTARPE